MHVKEPINWDLHGDELQNRKEESKPRELFNYLHDEQMPVIRIALHARDPPEALIAQKQMIKILLDDGYEAINYSYIIKNGL